MKLPFYLEDPRASWYDEVPWTCLDLETTNIEKGDPLVPENRIVLRHAEGWLSIDKRPYILVAHNAKFELGWMLREGEDITNVLPWDTLLAEYCILGNRRAPLDLGSVARKYGFPGKEPVVDKLIKAGVCPSEIPRKWLEERVRDDVETTLASARKQH